MRKYLIGIGLAALVAGCAFHDADRGGAYDPTYSTGTVNTGSDTGPSPAAMGITTGQTNGPGMHSETPTGITGPGTVGDRGTNSWTGGTTP